MGAGAGPESFRERRMIKVSDYIAKRLADHGIRHVFMVTGGGAMHLNDSLGKESRLQYVCNHHEQACAMAAEGYAPRRDGNDGGRLRDDGPGRHERPDRRARAVVGLDPGDLPFRTSPHGNDRCPHRLAVASTRRSGGGHRRDRAADRQVRGEGSGSALHRLSLGEGAFSRPQRAARPRLAGHPLGHSVGDGRRGHLGGV